MQATLNAIAAKSPQQLMQFVVLLAFEVSITARATYVQGSTEVLWPTALRGLMEINHRILGWTRDLLREAEGRSVETCVVQLYELARDYDCADEFNCAISYALENP